MLAEIKSVPSAAAYFELKNWIYQLRVLILVAISDQHPVSIQKEPKILNLKKKLQEYVTQQNPHSISAGYEFETFRFALPVGYLFSQENERRG